MPDILKDKVAIVTGAGRGIGTAYARRFAKEGAKLLLADINYDSVQKVAAEIKASGGTAAAVKTDISSESSVKNMANEVMNVYGRVDILLNNAALAYFPAREMKTWDTWPVEEWDRAFAVNVRGTWMCVKETAPLMKKQNRGKIINVASDTIEIRGGMDILHYVVSKGAVVTLTKQLARILGPFNINVNCIAPGLTATEATMGVLDNDGAAFATDRFESTCKGQCIQRREEPDDLVGTAVYLASADSDFVTGQLIFVNGGMTCP
jgi:3-oxoacyl-[acyl-carrier protein] reductase